MYIREEWGGGGGGGGGRDFNVSDLGGGGKYEKSSFTNFFLIYAPLQTFSFFEMQAYFLHISFLQAIYFVFLGPANNCFNIFHTPPPPPEKIMVRPSTNQQVKTNRE